MSYPDSNFDMKALQQSKERCLEVIQKYSYLRAVYTEHWVEKVFATGFPKGIHPAVKMLASQMPGTNEIHITMDEVFSLIDWKTNSDKVKELQNYNNFYDMFRAFFTISSEVYLFAYLTKFGLQPKLQRKGADITLNFSGLTIDIEVTTKLEAIYNIELDDLIERITPKDILDRNIFRISGDVRSNSQLMDFINVYKRDIIDSGEKNVSECGISITLEPVGEGQGGFFSRRKLGFTNASQEAIYAVQLKVQNKSKEKNQAVIDRPTVIVVDMGLIRDSHELIVLQPIQPISFPIEQILPAIDGVLMYWQQLDKITPWNIKGFVRSNSRWKAELEDFMKVIID